VIFDVRPNGELELMRRDATGGEMIFLAGGTQPPPTWLKLRRIGTVVTGYVSADGNSWQVVGYATLPFRSHTYVGLAVSSHDTGVTTTATFDHVTVAPTWTSHDIGVTSSAEPPANGALYSVSNNHFTVHATGADIWGSADELHFVHMPVRGSGSISARVAVLSAADDFAKSGVMLRASLAPDAGTVIFDVRPNGELEFMVRPAAGEEMSFIAGGTRSVPIWLMLQRDGSQVIAQTSPNGITWTLLATVDIALPDVVYAGLAVTSRDPASAAATLIDGLSGWWSGVP
jgi:regulation of enolase protein 1 (concanavalin A-like superfamily)